MMTVEEDAMYYLILIALSITTIVCGWIDHPALILIGGVVLGHAFTEVLNDPT